jgi:hypothetical protein
MELRKLWPPKVEGTKTQKKKPQNAMKANFQTPKKILIYCSITTRIPK